MLEHNVSLEEWIGKSFRSIFLGSTSPSLVPIMTSRILPSMQHKTPDPFPISTSQEPPRQRDSFGGWRTGSLLSLRTLWCPSQNLCLSVPASLLHARDTDTDGVQWATSLFVTQGPTSSSSGLLKEAHRMVTDFSRTCPSTSSSLP